MTGPGRGMATVLAPIAFAFASACSAAVCPTAAATARAIAAVPADAPIAAYGNWVVWSDQAPGGGWMLVARHGAVVAPVAVASRPAPFDVDLGTDGDGRVVATFSRCSKTVAPTGEFTGARGRGCRIRVVDLATGRERSAAVPRPSGASDTVPSMWRGRIAFARNFVRNGSRRTDVDQVMLWDPVHKRMRRLRHGATPNHCYPGQDCTGGPHFSGQVQAVDLGARLVAFRWRVEGTAIDGHGATEMRADRLRDGHNLLLATGYTYEACDETDSVTSLLPGTPSVDGGDVWFLTRADRCETRRFDLERVTAAPFRGASAPLSGEILQLVRSGNRLYALVAPKPDRIDGPSCPCMLQQIDTPELRRYHRRPARQIV